MNRHALLYVVVFLSGASVLAIEIVGTRVLGPFYGVSLFLWSALITVTLAALSLGYVIGGRLADRNPSYSSLALIISLAGVWVLLTPWIKRPVLDLLEPIGLRGAVLLASTILFFPPLALLGMVSPFAIRLRTERLEEVGRTAGNIYAVSTVASVVAALLTGFVLIPNVGVTRLILLVGVGLLLAALVALTIGRSSKGVTAVLLVIILAGGVVAWMVPLDNPDPEKGLLTIRQSPYAEIRVVDWDESRILFIDGGGHTVIERESKRNLYPYVNVMEINKYLYPEPGKMLLIGLGGGSIARSYDEGGWEIDVVEIDPVVVDVAREFFGFDRVDADVSVMDGRQFLLSTEESYDLIILDAFGSSSIPFHLITKEAFGLIADRMNEDAVLAINIESDGWYDLVVRSLAATLGEAFSTVLALPLSEPRTEFGNLVIMASNRPIEFDEGMLGRPSDFVDDPYWHGVVLDRNHAWDNRFEPDQAGVPVLTDDLNPVDLWAERLNLEARRRLHSDYDWKSLSY